MNSHQFYYTHPAKLESSKTQAFLEIKASEGKPKAPKMGRQMKALLNSSINTTRRASTRNRTIDYISTEDDPSLIQKAEQRLRLLQQEGQTLELEMIEEGECISGSVHTKKTIREGSSYQAEIPLCQPQKYKKSRRAKHNLKRLIILNVSTAEKAAENYDIVQSQFKNMPSVVRPIYQMALRQYENQKKQTTFKFYFLTRKEDYRALFAEPERRKIASKPGKGKGS